MDRDCLEFGHLVTVQQGYASWISQMVQEYGIDGLRIDGAYGPFPTLPLALETIVDGFSDLGFFCVTAAK